MSKLYLASKSPRRREILESLGITQYTVLPVGDLTPYAYAGDEPVREGEGAADYVLRTAREKFLGALARIEAEKLVRLPVLSADTAVIVNDTILGKPADREEARAFMRTLSGRWHEVRTAVMVGHSAQDSQSAVSVSRVHFIELREDQIEAYVATAEPYDKAGGYGIQGRAGAFIDRIDGSFTGIMGLPAYETAQLLDAYLS